MPLKLWEHKDTSVQLGVNWGGVPSGNVDQPVFIWETLIVVPGKMCKWCWLYRSGAVKKVYLIQTFRSYQKKGRSRSGGGICFRENVNSGECSSETKQRPREYVTDKEKLGRTEQRRRNQKERSPRGQQRTFEGGENNYYQKSCKKLKCCKEEPAQSETWLSPRFCLQPMDFGQVTQPLSTKLLFVLFLVLP